MSGLPHFYPEYCVRDAILRAMCQCPMSGLPHFYAEWLREQGYQRYVSMPYVGLTSFPQNLSWIHLRILLSVNALCRAYLISTAATLVYTVYQDVVSMPCVGLTSFLHVGFTCNYCNDSVCQCPVSGLPHFYPAPLRASVYAGFSACFCRYFSEYSEKYPKQGAKVGKGLIVFF